MASAELKEIRKALTKESIREHQLSKVGGTETDMFICGKCRGKNCTYTQVCCYNRPEMFKLAVIIKTALNLKLDTAVGYKYSPPESICTLEPYLKKKTRRIKFLKRKQPRISVLGANSHKSLIPSHV